VNPSHCLSSIFSQNSSINANGPEITDSFRNYEGIIGGSPTRVAVDEKTELARIVKGFQDKSNPDSQR